MGEKSRKSNRGPSRGRVVVHSPKIVSQEKNANIERVDDGVKVIKEKKPCPHLENGIDLDKLAAKLQSSEPIRCEDCRERVNDRRVSKGKGKSGKKKGSASLDSKSESKVWVCLESGHYACGGVGLPTADQTHAVRHIRQTRHRLMIQCENPQLRWCFPCSTLLPIEKIEENGETKDVLVEVVKLLKQRPSEASASSVDVDDGDGVKVIKEKKLCPHLENGVDLDKLAAKLQSSEPIRCEDCKERVNDRRVRERVKVEKRRKVLHLIQNLSLKFGFVWNVGIMLVEELGCQQLIKLMLFGILGKHATV